MNVIQRIHQNINYENEEDFSEEELKKVKRNLYRNYKIQEVIARRQILLVQVVKEESDYLGSGKVTKKKRIKAQKYLAESRRDLDLSSKKLTS